MPQDTTSLPSGAGATNRSTSSDTNQSTFSGTGGGSQSDTQTPRSFSSSTTGGTQSSSFGGGYRQEQSDYGSSRPRSMAITESSERPSTAVVLGAALVGAIAGGAIPFMLAKRPSGGQRRHENAVVQESVTIDRPARELYDFWRNFENLPQFMDNIKSVRKHDERRSHWVIKAPAGTSVEFDSRVTDDVPGKLIAWESEEGASVPNRGRVEFDQASSGNGTVVRATISYDPPAGAAGRAVAKLFQREPAEQARQDLARFKELMERGAAR